LSTAAQLMWEHDFGALPVMGSDDRVIGIVTDRDICMAAYTQGRPLHAISVQVAMAKEVFTCRPEDSVEDAEHLMGDKQIRRLPVLDEAGQLVGMLSLGDVARELGASRKKNVVRELVHTLASICTPRAQSIQLAPSRGATASRAARAGDRELHP
ncbi:MAG: CBS domain-containing protein, partial [Polyangiales bacterium]